MIDELRLLIVEGAAELEQTPTSHINNRQSALANPPDASLDSREGQIFRDRTRHKLFLSND